MRKNKIFLAIKKIIDIFIRISKYILLGIVLIFLFLLLPPVQGAIARFVTNKLNETYGTEIQVDRVSFGINGTISLGNILIRDYKKDSLISASRITTSITDFQKLINGDLYFGEIYGEEVRLNMIIYKGDSISNLDFFVNRFDDGKPSSGKFIMKSDGISLKNSYFKAMDFNNEDPHLVDIKDIQANVSDFLIEGSDVYLKANSGSLLLDNHLSVKDIKTRFAYTNNFISLSGASIQTNHSLVEGNVKFLSNNGSYSKFIYNVPVEADIQKSSISTNDINGFFFGFSPEKTIDFQGIISGKIDDLVLENSEANYQNTNVKGNFYFKNIFQKNETFEMIANVDNFSSIHSDLASLMPKILGENLPKELENLGFTHGNGKVNYTTKDLEVDMAFNSSSGDLDIQGFFADINDLTNTTYKGRINTCDFDIKDFLKEKKPFIINSNFQVVGKSLDFNNLNQLSVEGIVEKVSARNRQFENIKINGIINKKIVKGNASINDANLKMNLLASVDMNKPKFHYDLTAEIEKADLIGMQIIENDSIANLKGITSIDVKTENIDDIIGNIQLKNLTFERNDTVFDFDNFNINISEIDTEKKIILTSSDILSGEIKGNFKLSEIHKLIINSLGNNYKNYKPHKVSEGQFLSFNTQVHSKVIEAFLTNVAIAKNSNIQGTIGSKKEDFFLNFNTNAIHLKDTKLQKINLLFDNKTNANALFSVDAIDIDGYKISNLTINKSNLQDTLLFSTSFKGGKNDKFSLNFYHTLNEKESSVIGLKKSEIIFKNKLWDINSANKDNYIIFDKQLDSIRIEHFKIEHKEQSISFNGKLFKDTYKDLHLVFDRVQLLDIIPDIQGLKLEGETNGHLSLIQEKNRYFPLSSLTIENFTLNNHHLGNLEMEIQGSEDLNTFKVNTYFVNEREEGFYTIGDIHIKGRDTHLDLYSNLQQLSLKPFAPFFDDVFSNVRGYINGSARISGKILSPKVEGFLKLENAGLGIPYLNVDVDFSPDTTIRIKDNSLIFNEIELTDVAYKTKSYLNGKIFNKNFTDWYLDLHLDTKNKRFLALNTKEIDNELFYGLGFIKGKASITGSTDNLLISIKADTAEGTKFKIPLSDTQTIGDDSFIHFVSKKNVNEKQEIREFKTISGIEMKFDMNILPIAEVEIITDRKSGSTLIGNGIGTLLLDINTNGKFNMWGDFITTSGEYNFKYEGIIDKKFKVLPGGSISWSGNPYNAELTNLKAVYSLYSNPSILLESNQYNRKIQTQVEINLNGKLTSPETIFDIKFPDANPALLSELDYRLKDVDKKQLQAFSLLLQGNFLSDASAGEKVVSYNMLETAAGIFNDLLSTEDDKVNFGLSYEAGSADPNDFNNSDRLGITLTTQLSNHIFFNGKLGIPLGGATQTAIAGDFEFQFLLNQDGSLSAKIFNRENEVQQYFLEKIGYTQGVGLSYKVDFNTFKELIRGILKKSKK